MMLIGDEPQSYPSYRDIADIDAASRRDRWVEVALTNQNVALREPTTRLLHASTPEGGQVKPLTSKESQ